MMCGSREGTAPLGSHAGDKLRHVGHWPEKRGYGKLGSHYIALVVFRHISAWPGIATPRKVPQQPLSARIFAPLNESGMVSGVLVNPGLWEEPPSHSVRDLGI